MTLIIFDNFNNFLVFDYIKNELFISTGFNGVIKRVVTFRDKLDVADFIESVLIKWTDELSSDYGKGSRVIAQSPIIDIDLRRRAHLWLTTAKLIENDGVFYVASSTLHKDINFDLAFVNNLNYKKYKSIELYLKERCRSFWTVQL